MKKRGLYRATDVKDVSLEAVLKAAPSGPATVGLDIGKYELSAVLRWHDGSFERPWKAKSPAQIDRLVELLRQVAEHRPLVVGMESTGTYGEAPRARLAAAGLTVHRVGGKARMTTPRYSTECRRSMTARTRR
jgi:transposase